MEIQKQSQPTDEQGWYFYLTTLKLNQFKMVEAMGLKIIVLRSPWMTSHAYQI
jgi:hypothetical protein